MKDVQPRKVLRPDNMTNAPDACPKCRSRFLQTSDSKYYTCRKCGYRFIGAEPEE